MTQHPATRVCYLLAFPVGLMGSVQLFFALLSLLVFRDGVALRFVTPAVAMLGSSLLALWLCRQQHLEATRIKDALIFASATWIIMGVLGSFPIASIAGVSFTDSVFESISGITTTGSTILVGLDSMPRSFLMYRQFLQWLGGLGVVIFVVAVLPLLNIGGMKLLKAETPGPIKDEKLTPRIANTAHYLWLIYFVLTLSCALAYLVAGMSPYDAIAHSLTTISTGGFSTYDASMGHFENPRILMVANVFMLLGAISFALHFHVWRSLRASTYLHSEETRTFLVLVLVLSLSISASLFVSGQYAEPLSALNDATFHLISFMTSTGYGAGNYTEWPAAVAFVLIFASYLGGCAGSTAGGNKIIRNIIIIKLVKREMQKLLHPRGVFKVKFDKKPLQRDVISSIFAFMSLAAGATMVLTFALMLTGLDFWSAFTGVVACINVLGPAFGELGSNFIPVSDAGTWILSFAMILGRLEYFTILVLLLPAFWRE